MLSAGMFVPFAILMMPVSKTDGADGTGKQSWSYYLYVVFYMPMNVLLYSGYLDKYPIGIGRSSLCDGAVHGKHIGRLFSNHENQCMRQLQF